MEFHSYGSRRSSPLHKSQWKEEEEDKTAVKMNGKSSNG